MRRYTRDHLRTIFDYQKYSSNKKTVYQFTKALHVNVCPYCNRQYTYTISEHLTSKEIVRPELDHFFPKSKFPMFALSFFNLIPCCHICNSIIKGDDLIKLEEYYHPYEDEDKDFSFMYYPDNDRMEIILLYHHLEKARKTCNYFRLPDIYRFHNDEATILDQIFHEYPPEYIDDLLANRYPNATSSFTKEQMLRWLYGRFIIQNENEEVLGKLRADLYGVVNKLYT